MTPEEAARSRQRVVTLMAHGSICHRCGHGGATNIEHVIPITDGGDDAAGNLAPICSRCVS